MTNLITISNNNTITAKELYDFLELNPNNFARWTNKNIADNQFAEENTDFVRLLLQEETPTGGKIERTDYELTIDFAKKLCMISKSNKGEEARNYFIEVEKRLVAIQQTPVIELPTNYLEALKALVTQTERVIEVEQENVLLVEQSTVKDQIINDQQEDIDIMQPKAERYDCFMNTDSLLTMQQVASSMAIKRFGPNVLYKLLRESGVLNSNNVPYRRYVNNGCFKTTENGSYINPKTNQEVMTTKTMVSIKGQNYIYDLVMDQINVAS